MSTRSAAPAVAIFRQQLFKPSEAFIVEQARSLRRYRATLFGRELHGPVDPELPSFVPTEWGRVRRALFAAIGRPDAFSARLQDLRPRLVHAHFGPDGLAILAIARRLGLPLAVTMHGFDVAIAPPRMLLAGKPSLARYAMGYRRLMREADLFLCVSEAVRQRVLERGFPAERVVRHYIGTDTAAIPGPYPERETQAPVVLHVARLVEKKGTEYLLRAFASLGYAYPNARLVIVGGGPLREELNQLASRLGLTSRVEFLGAQPHAEIRRWLRRASVFALPSVTAASGDAEGLPVAILEAASAALPIVATWHSGIPEAIEDGRGGFLVPERHVGRLAERLAELLASQGLREEMGARAQAHVRSHFCLARQSAELEQLYDKIAH